MHIIHYTYTFNLATPRKTPPPAHASSESARPSYKTRAFATFSSLLTSCFPPRYRSSAADDTHGAAAAVWRGSPTALEAQLAAVSASSRGQGHLAPGRGRARATR